MRRIFGLAFLGYFLLAGAWAVALPTNGTYDEKQHLVRAYAVWDGQFLPHGTARDGTGLTVGAFNAPRSLLPGNVDCAWRSKPRKPASCQHPVTDSSRAAMPSSAARYSPVYYLLVGLPLRIAPDYSGLVWARLLSAAFSGVLLAAAMAIAVRLLRNRILTVALVLIATPMVMNLAGSINPNGLEITAGALVFVSLLALLREPSRRLALAFGVSSFLLLTVRQLGPLLWLVAVAACLLACGRFSRSPRFRLLLGPSASAGTPWLPRFAGARAAVTLVVLGFVGYVGWLLVAGRSDANPPASLHSSMTVVGILRGIEHGRYKFYLDQVVGQFDYGETTIAQTAVVIWYVLFLALVLPALWRGGNRLRLAMVGLAAFCAVLIVGLEIHYVPLVGWFAQSRYVLPVGVGVVLLAGFCREYALPLWVAVALAAVPVLVELYALARVMTRFQVSINAGVSPFHGTWLPGLGPVTPLVSCFVGGVLLAVIVGTSSVRQPPVPSTVNTASN